MAGETQVLAAAARGVGKKVPFAALVGNPWLIPYLTTELELADVKEVGYLPAGVTLLGFFYCPDALAASALVQKITVGATDVLTGLIGAVLGTKTLQLITPIVIADKTLVKVTCTTAAVTPAAGNIWLTPIYFST